MTERPMNAAQQDIINRLPQGIVPPKTPMEGGFSLEKFMPGLLPEDAEAFGEALESADLSEETTSDRLARMGYRHEPSSDSSQNGRDIVRADGKRIGTMTCTEANEFCDLLDLQNTIGAIADPTDYETGGEKTVETCQRLASECMARNNL